MKSTSKMIISVVVGLLLSGGAYAYLNGWITASPKDTHPPCGQLPSVSEAAVALENHERFAKEIEKLGDGVKVEVVKPCPDHQDRGLVQVSYNSKSEHDAISKLLTRNEGFGVPVHLVKR
ncbi:hypothetical protein [Bacillus xiapuensis]|uniref:hypothetical protein n=1 Tax=Bacillus xiapuensis TaxID=2014075 RepID=UPI000C230DDA|nr:hypothetical protein [Bacillus xiapuensis]